VSDLNPMDIAGRVAIVTGAATGVGRGIAEHFARVGARVLLCDLDEAGADVAKALASQGHAAAFRRTDVSSADDAAALVEDANARFGGLDILVNNAGIQVEKTIEELEPSEWDRLMDVNMKGVYLCSKFAIPAMRSRGGGSIVNIASVNGFWVEPGLGAYCASKGGVIALTRSTASDFGRDGIRCNCICPGYVDTGMAGRYLDSQADPERARAEVATLHAVGRVGQPADIAACAQFLASDAAGFATGAAFVLDGGLSLGVVAQPE
jgi:NAD(P)-dependent dehydrogenase (short-subunit alcohol dehydrogenase family)